MPVVEIYTDGACRGNPGPGGWGALLCCEGNRKELQGAEAHTTNNRMELMAAIQGLSALTRACDVILTTDSQYVKQGITTWIHQWKKKNWITSQKEPVKNADLWKQLDALNQIHQIEWRWVKAHNGHPENERVDTLAREAIDEQASFLQKE